MVWAVQRKKLDALQRKWYSGWQSQIQANVTSDFMVVSGADRMQNTDDFDTSFAL